MESNVPAETIKPRECGPGRMTAWSYSTLTGWIWHQKYTSGVALRRQHALLCGIYIYGLMVLCVVFVMFSFITLMEWTSKFFGVASVALGSRISLMDIGKIGCYLTTKVHNIMQTLCLILGIQAEFGMLLKQNDYISHRQFSLESLFHEAIRWSPSFSNGMNYSYPPWYIDFITGHTCGYITSKTEMQYHFKCINKLDLLAVFYRFVSLIDDDVRGMWLILGMYQIQGIDFCTVEWKMRRSIITWQKKYITHTRTVIFMTQAITWYFEYYFSLLSELYLVIGHDCGNIVSKTGIALLLHISMGLCKKDVTPVTLALTHRYINGVE